MKLKVNKAKDSIWGGIKTIYSNKPNVAQCVISIDVDGYTTLENFKKINDYTENKIVIETSQKNVYIYGEELKLVSCNKCTAIADGLIKKIEIFDKEV